MEKLKIIISWILRFAIAGIFIWAGTIKLLRPDEFYYAINAYQVLDSYSAFVVTYFLPPFEILSGLALLSKQQLISGLFAIFVMTMVFIIAISSAWIRGLDISCGCFGGGDSSDYSTILLRDFAILLAVFVIFKLNFSKRDDSTRVRAYPN